MEQPPESIPINALVAVEGTPLEDQKPIEIWEMIRMIATSRILFPKSIIRLSAGRTQMSHEAQALCFFAGASSIFAGDKLLTTPNPEFNEDKALFDILGITPKAPFQDGDQPTSEVDEKVEKAKKVRAEKEARKKDASKVISKGTEEQKDDFQPRKVTVE